MPTEFYLIFLLFSSFSLYRRKLCRSLLVLFEWLIFSSIGAEITFICMYLYLMKVPGINFAGLLTCYWFVIDILSSYLEGFNEGWCLFLRLTPCTLSGLKKVLVKLIYFSYSLALSLSNHTSRSLLGEGLLSYPLCPRMSCKLLLEDFSSMEP